MKIKVGNKYVSKKDVLPDFKPIVEILYIGEKGVYYKHVGGKKVEGSQEFEYFKKHYQPYPQFKWLKPTNITIALGGYSMVVMPEDMKSYELKLNYDRYHEQYDNVEFEDIDTVWYIDNEFVITDNWYADIAKMTPVFSTEKHADTFFDLAKENDCL